MRRTVSQGTTIDVLTLLTELTSNLLASELTAIIFLGYLKRGSRGSFTYLVDFYYLFMSLSFFNIDFG